MKRDFGGSGFSVVEGNKSDPASGEDTSGAPGCEEDAKGNRKMGFQSPRPVPSRPQHPSLSRRQVALHKLRGTTCRRGHCASGLSPLGTTNEPCRLFHKYNLPAQPKCPPCTGSSPRSKFPLSGSFHTTQDIYFILFYEHLSATNRMDTPYWQGKSTPPFISSVHC